MDANGFSSDEFRIIHGVAALEKGIALFPVVDNAGASWGSEPILNATAAQVKEASASGQYQQLSAVPLAEIVEGEPVDLLHIDIQGAKQTLSRQLSVISISSSATLSSARIRVRSRGAS